MHIYIYIYTYIYIHIYVSERTPLLSSRFPRRPARGVASPKAMAARLGLVARVRVNLTPGAKPLTLNPEP